MQKTNLIFDWGGVLGENNNKYAANILSQKYTINYDKLFHDLEVKDVEFSAKRTLDETKDFYNFFVVKYGIKYDDIVTAHSDVPANETFEFIKTLANNFNLYLLSDQLFLRARSIEKHNDMSVFNQTFFSCDTGFTKDNKKAFENILQKISAKPEDCIFIDDREKNLQTASQLGIQTILYADLESFKKSLEMYGIFNREVANFSSNKLGQNSATL